MKIITFKAEHLAAMDTQDAQARSVKHVTHEQAIALENEFTFSGEHDGRILCAFGVFEIWPGRHMAWSHLDRRVGAHMPMLHKAVMRMLNVFKDGRVEAAVDMEFTEGHRWMLMLGFVLETPRARKYRPDGGDSALYVRVQ